MASFRGPPSLEEEAFGGLTRPPTMLGQEDDADERVMHHDRRQHDLDHSMMGGGGGGGPRSVEGEYDGSPVTPPRARTPLAAPRAPPPLFPMQGRRDSGQMLQEAPSTPPTTPAGQPEPKDKNLRFVVLSIVVLIFIVLVLAAITVFLFVTDNGGANNDSLRSNNEPPTTTSEPSSAPVLPPTAAPSAKLHFLTETPVTLTPTMAKIASSLPTALPTVAPTRTAAPFPSCPVCANGQALRNPMAFLPNSTATCGYLERIIDTLVEDSEDPEFTCLEWQVIASYSCGCTFPHPQSVCTICPDGSLPQPHVLGQVTPVLSQDDENVNLTCSDLIYSAAVFTRNREPACSQRVIPRWAPYCACPGYAPEDASDSTPIPTPAPTTLPTTSEPTIIDGDSLPGNRTRCTVCSDRRAVPTEYRDKLAVVKTDGRNVTCAEFERSIAFFTEDCSDLQLYGTLNCGCTSPHPDSPCWLCPNGDVPPPEFHKKVLAEEVEPSGGFPLTCRDVYFDAAQSRSEDSQACLALQTKYASACGCSPMEGTMVPSLTPVPSFAVSQPSAACTLCADGLAFEGKFVDDFAVTLAVGDQVQNFTCLELEEGLDLLVLGGDESSLDCFELQLWGSLNCGCQSPHPDTICSLCPDGEVPPKEYRDRVLTDDDGTVLTCSDLYLRAARDIDTLDECTLFQSTFARDCGCNVQETLEPSTTPLPSAAVSTVPSTFTLAPTRDDCFLCVDEIPVADEFRDEWALTTLAGRNLTCAELEESLDTFTTECQLLQLFGILNCGCQPRPHPEATCWLCPNGNVPPLDFLSLELDNAPANDSGRRLTCMDLYFEAAQTIDNEQGCESFQNAYALRCGCDVEGDQEEDEEEEDRGPAPRPLQCQMCANGEAPPFLDAIAVRTATANITCRELESEIDALIMSDPSVSPRAVCFLVQLKGSLHCGCQSPHPRSDCWICPDGSVPPQERLWQTVEVVVLDDQGQEMVQNKTCADIAQQVGRISSQEECNEAVSQYSQLCGCPTSMVSLP